MLRADAVVSTGRSTRRRRWWGCFAPAIVGTTDTSAIAVNTIATVRSLLLLNVGFDKIRILLNLIFCDTLLQQFIKYTFH